MQEIHIEKPYEFIPPHRGKLLPSCIRHFNLFALHLRKSEGVVGYEIRNLEPLRQSLDAGHGILLTPNHCRSADPLLFGWLANEAKCLL